MENSITVPSAGVEESIVTSSEDGSDVEASTSSSSEDSQTKQNTDAQKPDAESILVAGLGIEQACQAYGKPVIHHSSESEDSGDDTSDADEHGTGGVQQQVFSRLDCVLESGGPAADVFAAMKAGMQQTSSQALKRQLPDDVCGRTAASVQQPRGVASAGGSAPLRMPKRTKQNGWKRTEWDVVKDHKSNVRVARNAAGSIGKHADGAAAFVVFMKVSGRWLLLNFASEVLPLRLRCCVMHAAAYHATLFMTLCACCMTLPCPSWAVQRVLLASPRFLCVAHAHRITVS